MFRIFVHWCACTNVAAANAMVRQKNIFMMKKLVGRLVSDLENLHHLVAKMIDDFDC
jgi:hypothetical protein